MLLAIFLHTSYLLLLLLLLFIITIIYYYYYLLLRLLLLSLFDITSKFIPLLLNIGVPPLG